MNAGRPNSQGPTLADVAEVANVSVSTASRALHGGPRSVSGPLRERVVAAAAHLGYVPNASAQIVVRGRSNVVALVVPDIADPYFSSIAAGVFAEAETADAVVTVAVSEHSQEQEFQIVSALRRQRPRAIVVAGSRWASSPTAERTTRELIEFQSEGGRVVMISQPTLPFDTIAPQNKEGAHDLVTAIIQLGYERFAVLAGPRDHLAAQDRLLGAQSAFAEHDITVRESNIIHVPMNRDGGYSGAGELLTRSSDAQLVLCANDLVALGAMSRFRQSHRRIPEDIGFSGFDDLTVLRDVVPSLTSCALPLEAAGRQALEWAVESVPKGSKPRTTWLRPRIMLRDSTPGVAG